MSARAPRPAARILLTDDAGRILLFRFDTGDRPPLWATPGGALDPGEDHAAAAARELREETGLSLPCGPEVAQRTVEFTTLLDEPVIADERYFLIRTDGCTIDCAGHSDHELRVMREWRWFDRSELGRWAETIFPEDLAQMLDEVDPR